MLQHLIVLYQPQLTDVLEALRQCIHNGQIGSGQSGWKLELSDEGMRLGVAMAGLAG